MLSVVSQLKSVHHVIITTALLATAFTSGCATPTGAAFSGAETVAEGSAQIYLYRKSALASSADGFDVKLNQQDMGELLNGSFMRLPVAPGTHVLSVKPNVFSQTYERTLQVADKQTIYVQFGVPPILLMNAFMLGSDLNLRTSEEATADLKDLKAVK